LSGGRVGYRYGEPAVDGVVRYHYAPYEGQAFLDAYRASRSALVATCSVGGVTLGGDVFVGEAIDRLRRQFEVHGRLGDSSGGSREEVGRVAMLWLALARRCAVDLKLRDLNCMMKLGDRISQVGVDGLDGEGRASANAAARLEIALVEEVRSWGRGGRRGPESVRSAGVRPQRRPSRGRNVRDGVGAARSFGMLVVSSSRSRAYIDVLARSGVLPRIVVYVSRGADDDGVRGEAASGFDNVTPVLQRLRDLGVETLRIAPADVNEPRVARAVADCDVELMVYSGSAGVKVKPALLRAGAEFLHVHGGRLPEQRGSTTCYYSLLEEGCCWAAVILLAERLDRGAVVAQRTYAPPQDRTAIDHGYDPLIRADLLASVLRRYVEHGLLPRLPQPVTGTMHYVMHPVLRHVAILAGAKGEIHDGAAALQSETARRRDEVASAACIPMT
jgi:methionyl-tRNA formyltransferase